MTDKRAHPSDGWDLTFAMSPDVSEGQTDPAKPIRFSGVAYSGGVIPDYGWIGDVAIDLSTLKNPGAKVPVMADHGEDLDGIAGSGVITIITDETGSRLSIDGVTSAATESGRLASSLMIEGHPLQMSVRISATMRETDGEEVINGRPATVDYVFENALVREVSFCPMGADPMTGAHAAFSASHKDFQPAKEGADMARSADDEALITAQAAEIATLKAAAAEAKMSARKAAIAALFAAVGRDVPADVSAYVEMSDAAFAAYSQDMKELHKQTKPAADQSLFSSQAAQRVSQGVQNVEFSVGAQALFASIDAMTKKG